MEKGFVALAAALAPAANADDFVPGLARPPTAVASTTSGSASG
jgi:hypothetical protein